MPQKWLQFPSSHIKDRYDYGGLFDQEAEETAFGSLQLGGDRSFGFQA